MYGSKPTPECSIHASPPQPTVVTNISVLSYQFSFTETSSGSLVSVEVAELSLAWMVPAHPNAQLEDLHYEVWVGSDATIQPEDSDVLLLENNYEAENEVKFINVKPTFTKLTLLFYVHFCSNYRVKFCCP